ncbi:hypothetical protein [Cohnella sp. WQ 127256]|uniref:hypothetical protein n=1 Tax=Cohnella sp. WQ 127256 TaxID=2938790 RepID=UPI002117EAF0|nr:hypothetical protein [Cohnella sp. WQ 127256]
MRNGISQRLTQAIPLIAGRVVEAHESMDSLIKPYVLLVQGADAEDTQWTGLRTSFEVWPYVSQTAGFADVDELANLIVTALDGQAVTDPDTNEAFTCQYEGNVGADKVDIERNALTRGLRFSVIGVQRVSELDVVQEDDWIVALSEWTKNELGSADWQVYNGKWPTDYTRPSVLWRLEGMESIASSRAATIEVRKKAVGHVIGRTVSEQTAAIVELTQSLTSAVKIPLSLPDRRYLTVLSPIVDLEQDTMTEGQISVTLSRKIERHLEDSPLMREVNFQTKL